MVGHRGRAVRPVVLADVTDEQERRRDDRGDEADGDRDGEERDRDDDGEDRQRRAHEEPDQHDQRHLEAAQQDPGPLGGHFFDLLALDVGEVVLGAELMHG